MPEIQKHSIPAGEVTYITLTNDSGARVVLSSLGAGIVSVEVPDAAGRMADVVVGYRDPADYMADGPCAGKCPGRYANRIARGHLEIDGTVHQLAINNGPNALHGGPTGFQNRIWKVAEVSDNKVVFAYTSADGEEGYPGRLDVRATYTWSDANELTLRFEARTDRPTAVNLTNHAYWNLSGHDAGTAMGHILRLYASRWLPTDETLVPTGELAPVAGTPMDFTEPKALGRDIRADFPALKYGKGYDNCWGLDAYDGKGTAVHAARLEDPESGRVLDVYTTQPGVQVYTGNWFEGSPKSKSGSEYHDYDAVAIECQAFPDSPNKPQFPGTILRPGEKYDQTIIFRFSAK